MFEFDLKTLRLEDLAVLDIRIFGLLSWLPDSVKNAVVGSIPERPDEHGIG